MRPNRKNSPKSKRPRGSRAPAARPGSRLHVGLVTIGLAVATLAVYGQVTSHEFVSWDDNEYVYDNAQVGGGLAWDNFVWSFGIHGPGQWHPLTWWSHQLDCQMFGCDLKGPAAGQHHLVSVLLHIVAALILLRALWRLTGDFWPSALVAALFALHPLSVESVAWVSERRDTLSALFWALTMWAYAVYAIRGGRRRYLLVVLCFTMGLMAKPMLVTLPCVLLLLDYWPLKRLNLSAWRLKHEVTDVAPLNPQSAIRNPQFFWLLLEKAPLFALSGISIWLSYLCQQAAGAVESLEARPLSPRLANAAQSYVLYLRNMLWPVKLSPIYPFPKSFQTPLVASAVVLLVAITVAAVYFGRRKRYLLVGWLWYLGTLVPVIGLLKMGVDVSMADRYAYLSLIGIYIAIAWSLNRLVSHRPAARQGVIGVMVAVLLVLLPLTWRQIAVWRDNQSLYEHALATTRYNYMAHNNWGNVLQRQGRFGNAIAQFREALRIKPDLFEAHNNWGNVLKDQRRYEDAIAHYQMALQIKPDLAEAHNNLAWLWATCPESPIRDGRQALDHAQRAVELVGENNAAILDSLAAAHAQLGDFQQAVRWQQKAVDMAGKGIKDDLAARLKLYKQGQPFRETPQGRPYRQSN